MSLSQRATRPRFPLLFAFCLAAPVIVAGQTAATPPVARLITANPAYTRPRRVSPVSDSSATLTHVAPSPSLEEASSIEKAAFEATNRERVKNGLPALIWDADLCRMAREHSENMAQRGYFAHVTPDGARLRDRARAIGITHYQVLGENIAYNLGYDDPGTFAVERWMISPGHRANILRREFGRVGIGVLDGGMRGLMVSQEFRN